MYLALGAKVSEILASRGPGSKGIVEEEEEEEEWEEEEEEKAEAGEKEEEVKDEEEKETFGCFCCQLWQSSTYSIKARGPIWEDDEEEEEVEERETKQSDTRMFLEFFPPQSCICQWVLSSHWDVKRPRQQKGIMTLRST